MLLNVQLQLLCHLFGDYCLQSSWMANNKTKAWFPAVIHVIFYFLPFSIMMNVSIPAAAVMMLTHVMIDRFRLARLIPFGAHFLAPPSEWKSWSQCSETGYNGGTPKHIADWLLIIVD